MFSNNYSENKPPSALQIHQYAREMKMKRMLQPFEDPGENIRSLPSKSGYLANLSRKLLVLLETPLRRWITAWG